MKKQILFFIVIFLFSLKDSQATNSGKYYTEHLIKVDSLNTFGYEATGGSWTSYDILPRMVGDFDGDGNTDIIGFGETKTYITYSNGSGYSPEVEVSDSFGNDSTDFKYTAQNDYPRLVGDVDGDGMDDIIGFEDDGIYVSFSQGRGSQFTAKQRLYTGFGKSDSNWLTFSENPKIAGYIDGDNFIDIIGFNSEGVHILFGNGRNNFEVRDSTTLKIANKFNIADGFNTAFDDPRQVADVNGDGLGDIIGFSEFTNIAFQNTDGSFTISNDLTGQQFTSRFGWSAPNPRYVTDLNNDGKADIIGFARLIVVAANSEGNTIGGFYQTIDDYCEDDGWTNFNAYPRFLGDVNGDNIPDIIGFHDDGIVFSLGQLVCHSPSQTPIIRRDVNNECKCVDESYDNGDSLECPECIYPCVLCTSSSVCTTCATTDHRKSDGSCGCVDTYYDDTAKCEKCPRPCLNCSDSSTCDSCKGLNRIDDTTCLCENGYYDNTSDDDCQICPTLHKVFKCSSPTVITECKPGIQRTMNTSDCGCNHGFYDDNSNTDCQQCPFPNRVAKCTSSNTITECKSGTERTLTIPDCGCNIGYYDNGTDSDCIQCQFPHKVQSCTSNSIYTECKTGVERSMNTSDCGCNVGYYDDGSNADCIQCPNSYKVKSCSSSSTISECKIGFQRSMDTSDCGCNPGYFDDGFNLDCQVCSYPCINCTATNTCVGVCQTPENRNSSPECSCLDGYFDNGAICQQCDHSKCATCENSATECKLACQIGCKLCNILGECQEFEDGYFEDPLGNPQKCDRSCGTCENSATNCLIECEESCGLCNGDGNCETCSIGNYLKSDNSCNTCHPKCYSCSQFDQCTSCSLKGIGRSNNLEELNCGCLDGYYETGSLDCGKCPLNCKKCDSSEICIECSNSDLILPLCNSTKKGFFIKESNSEQIIQQCSQKCEKCESDYQQCTECANGLNRSKNPPCFCEIGYHDNDDTSVDCQKCSHNCLSCDNQYECLSCDDLPNLHLNLFSKKCECLPGFKMNIDTNLCDKCYQYNGDCVQVCPMNTRANEDKFTCEIISYQYKDNQTALLVCFSLVLLSFIFLGFYSLVLFRKKKNEYYSKDQKQILQLKI